MVICVIPARGGSKGIPLKNIQALAGKPLLAYTIEDARRSPSIDRVIVSTDAQEIAEVAAAYGAEVVWRPEAISGDTAPSELALEHVLDHVREEGHSDPELVVFLQATSPLRGTADVENAIRALRHENADSLFSACRVHGFVWRERNGDLRSLTYDYRDRPRRQDVGEDLLENGSIYVFKPRVLRTHGNRLGGKISVYVMNAIDSFQVDEPSDLVLMEELLRRGREPRRPHPDMTGVKLLALDFDGVMTDDRVLVSEKGEEAVRCHRGDGMGVEMLKKAGIPVVVVSKEKNPIVAARCRKLDVRCVQGCDDKVRALCQLVDELELTAEVAAYVGNDVNDVECLRWAGVGVAVADAVPEARKAAQWVTTRAGGHGAVREVCDLILASRRDEQSTLAPRARQPGDRG